MANEDVRRERRARSHRAVAITRDIVEIVAILAAGAWAIYTFVYQQRIVPANEPPSVLLTGSLQRMAERNGMVQMEYHATLRNTGHTRVYVIAEGFTVVGERYSRKGTPVLLHPFPGGKEYDRSARVVSSATVYRMEELTRYATAKSGSGYDIDPGEAIPYAGTFLVPQSDFDAVSITGSVAYTKVDRMYPTKVVYLPRGAIQFVSATNDNDFKNLEVTLDRATLW